MGSGESPETAGGEQTTAELRKELLTIIGQQTMTMAYLNSAVRSLAQGRKVHAKILDDLQLEHDVLMKLTDRALMRE